MIFKISDDFTTNTLIDCYDFENMVTWYEIRNQTGNTETQTFKLFVMRNKLYWSEGKHRYKCKEIVQEAYKKYLFGKEIKKILSE